jgi:hypothetical protein
MTKRTDPAYLAWHAAAFNAAVRFAKRAHKPFTIEQMRAAIGPRIDAPRDLRWWGEVTKAAKREGVIRPVDSAPAKSSHYSHKPTWIGTTNAFMDGLSDLVRSVSRKARG